METNQSLEKIRFIKEMLVFIWENKIKDKAIKGFILYERQFQAELYHQLNFMLYPQYNVWIEPHIQKKNKTSIIPDMIITSNDDSGENQILTVIELKWKPWEFPPFKEDIKKLIEFNHNELEEMNPLGAKSVSSNWEEVKGQNQLFYSIHPELLKVYVVFGHPGSDAIKPEKIETKPNNFLHLHGCIEKGQPKFDSEEIYFTIR
ncbi:MAG: hypothetical protein M0Q51_01505 [Bacteroidales bacterium]|nr:hypothetical protein [Bacteroidales bacterium]